MFGVLIEEEMVCAARFEGENLLSRIHLSTLRDDRAGKTRGMMPLE